MSSCSSFNRTITCPALAGFGIETLRLQDASGTKPAFIRTITCLALAGFGIKNLHKTPENKAIVAHCAIDQRLDFYRRGPIQQNIFLLCGSERFLF